MTHISYSVNIERPIQYVFGFVGNFGNNKYWWKAVNVTKKLTAGPMAVGTEFDQLSKVMFISIHNHLRVIDYQTPNSYSLSQRKSTIGIRSGISFRTQGGSVAKSCTVG